MLPRIIECSDTLDFLRHLERMGRKTWIYRGQSRYSAEAGSDWKLESSLLRFISQHKTSIKSSRWHLRERAHINRFITSAQLHLTHLPSRTDTLGWLSLLQHFGGPTRLLDFTFSPAIAMFFAIRESTPRSGPFSVHALHVDALKSASFDARKSLSRDTKTEPRRNPAAADYGIGGAPAQADFIGLFEGFQANPRQESQEGLFLIPSRIDLDVEDWLQKHLRTKKVPIPHSSPWVEFVFPNQGESYYTMLNQLYKAGMSAKVLFHDLQGVCESLKFSWLEASTDLEPSQDAP